MTYASADQSSPLLAGTLLLGCIADDFTGATDLASTLVQGGMRTLMVIGVPSEALEVARDYDAVVIALKSRTIPADDAVTQSLASLAALQRISVKQIFFKYCSTFDSTDQGNIGPVTEALLKALEEEFTIVCPSFPANGRTLYQGHLFVWDQLLSDSPMRHHPLTPMTDANLKRVLSRQTHDEVGLVRHSTVAEGVDSIRQRFEELKQKGIRQAIVDAIDTQDLMAIGQACRDLRLITGGSGIALGLPSNFQAQGLLIPSDPQQALPGLTGATAVLAGSCSQATQRQVAYMSERFPSYFIDPLRIAAGEDVAGEALQWATPKLSNDPVLFYATVPLKKLAEIQAQLGKEQAGNLVEETLSTIAQELVDAGVNRLIIAGGETSGAIVSTLGVKHLRIGPQIDLGVPWTTSVDAPHVQLVLKSGNFGTTDFFLKALAPQHSTPGADGLLE
jgi:uncharacterized protein YgbK (DUF1537 family)